MLKITPFLWFDGQAEEAMLFYTTIFKNSKVLNVSRLGEAGKAISVNFQLEGQELMAYNAGPEFKFNEAISLFVSCETQAEVDELWAKLTEGGEAVQCGWLKDKFGLSWQIVPADLSRYLGGPDPAGAQRAMQAMLKMVKLDIAEIKQAYEQG
jgi:predicted 3-demethylubiquinone-9 3-methyltransferase (glyoxalase superfamily)